MQNLRSIFKSLVEDYASDRVRQMNDTEAKLRFESIWQRLMSFYTRNPSEMAQKMKEFGVTKSDAQQIIDRLDAAPGDNLMVRAAANDLIKGQ